MRESHVDMRRRSSGLWWDVADQMDAIARHLGPRLWATGVVRDPNHDRVNHPSTSMGGRYDAPIRIEERPPSRLSGKRRPPREPR